MTIGGLQKKGKNRPKTSPPSKPFSELVFLVEQQHFLWLVQLLLRRISTGQPTLESLKLWADYLLKVSPSAWSPFATGSEVWVSSKKPAGLLTW